MRLFGKPKVAGELKFYGLEDWWFKALTTDERESIAQRFPDTIYGPVPLDSSAGAAQFLWGWASWFSKTPNDRVIARKILTMALDRARTEKRILDEHFAFQGLIEVWYRDRDTVPEALEQAITACQAQIAIAEKVAKAFRREYKGHPTPVPPTHTGYEQLRIIYEKQKRYDEAISLALDKKRTGWADDVSDYVLKMNEKKVKLAK